MTTTITTPCTDCGRPVAADFDPADPTDCAELAAFRAYAICDACIRAEIEATAAYVAAGTYAPDDLPY
jgi:hypothetical protein